MHWVTKTDGVDSVLRRCNELKITGRLSMDHDENGCEAIFFNRVLRIVHSENRSSFEILGDPRHAEIIVSEPGRQRERLWTRRGIVKERSPVQGAVSLLLSG